MFIMDAHCDTLKDVADGRRRLADRDKGGQLDLPRMIEGGVGAQIFAIYVSPEYLPGAGARRTL
ncbi:MAG: membrane dipeptidase, partial [Bacillota bacterium]